MVLLDLELQLLFLLPEIFCEAAGNFRPTEWNVRIHSCQYQRPPDVLGGSTLREYNCVDLVCWGVAAGSKRIVALEFVNDIIVDSRYFHE